MKALSFVVTLLVIGTVSAKFPASFQKCSYGKPDLEKCLIRAIQSAILQLSKDIPEAGLPNLEPLKIEKFAIGAGNGAVKVQERFFDVNMYGLRQIKVRRAKWSLQPDNMWVNFTSYFADLKLLGRYEADGHVMLFPINGHGNSTLILRNLTALEYFPLENVTKNGKTHLHITSAARVTLPKLGLLYVKFDDLFNGNQQLTDNINAVINENWEAIFDDVRSGYEGFFTETITNIFNNFLEATPLEEIFDNLDTKFLN